MNPLIPASTAQFWTLDHVPMTSETVQSGILYVGDYVTYTGTGDIYRCLDNTVDALKWAKMLDTNNTPGT